MWMDGAGVRGWASWSPTGKRSGSCAIDFNDKNVSAAYDDVLVPLFFRSWAMALVTRVQPFNGASVVDLATGTGVVAQQLAALVGSRGSVTAADISADMLSVAKQRCSAYGSVVAFVETPASPLALPTSSADVVYCQQGFQFFPDRQAAAAEMLRVLKPGGRVAVTTWCPVDQCEWFGAIHAALIGCDEPEIAAIIATPFNHMPAAEVVEHFSTAGFEEITAETPEADMVFAGGVEEALQAVPATPIGPRLHALSEQKRAAFREFMITALTAMTKDGVTSGRMVSNLLLAIKPRKRGRHCQ